MVLRTLFVSCAFLFFVDAVSLGSTMVGDILVETQSNGSLYCDSMICPEGSSQCRVTKRNDPNDFNIIIRRRVCTAPNGAVLLEQTINERNKFLGTVNVNVVSGGGSSNIGRPMTPEEKKELDDYLEKTQQSVQSQISQTFNQVYQSLGPLMDGSFATNLQNKINSNFRNLPFF